MIARDVIKEIERIVGRENVLADPEDLACYAYDATHCEGEPALVVMPGSTSEVSEIVRLANRRRLALVPRGSGTNLSGGTIPTPGSIVVCMGRFNRILDIDEGNLTATTQPGVLLGDFNREIESLGLFYPPDPSSQSISSLGGNVAEGAGGPRGVKYGTTKNYVIGLEVVTPTGEVLRLGGKAAKRGADGGLLHLMIGSEGTLGIITEITVRLLPKPAAKCTFLAAFDRLEDAARTVSAIIASRIVPTTIELMDRVGMIEVEKFRQVGLPTDAEAVLLIEVDGSEAEVGYQSVLVERKVRECGARDVEVARTQQEMDVLWLARRSFGAAVARSSPTQVTEDATVPRGKVPDMVRMIFDLRRKHRLRVAILAHAGDGNMHPAIMIDPRDRDEMRRVEQFTADLFHAALDLGGTLSGEHGMGILKSPYLEWQFGKEGVAAFRRMKAALDPNNVLNPGKLLPP